MSSTTGSSSARGVESGGKSMLISGSSQHPAGAGGARGMGFQRGGGGGGRENERDSSPMSPCSPPLRRQLATRELSDARSGPGTDASAGTGGGGGGHADANAAGSGTGGGTGGRNRMLSPEVPHTSGGDSSPSK